MQFLGVSFLQCIVGSLAAGEGIAHHVPVGHIHPAGLLQVKVLGGQVGEHAGHDVGGQDGLDGDVVGHQTDLFPPGSFYGRGCRWNLLLLGAGLVRILALTRSLVWVGSGELDRRPWRRRCMVDRIFAELGIAQAAVLG